MGRPLLELVRPLELVLPLELVPLLLGGGLSVRCGVFMVR